jgi:hypothetical protein
VGVVLRSGGLRSGVYQSRLSIDIAMSPIKLGQWIWGEIAFGYSMTLVMRSTVLQGVWAVLLIFYSTD